MLWIKQNLSENQKYKISVTDKYIVEKITLNTWKYYYAYLSFITVVIIFQLKLKYIIRGNSFYIFHIYLNVQNSEIRKDEIFMQ